ncbi:MAG TPA: hypothetical protein PLE36_14055 [Deltaproteobacteria bacterium]|jgi:hypothetical protein|nr:hypothetical protein [Deltaproteobacteria bacterium]NLW66213.1 hypothetical protein [Bacteriovoracaceae bacterium]HRR20846.1 hypothetical protein [Desulfomonilia bacterium]HNU74821.1 hypothetical protein [Deltaproteobacteria bacterium]HOD70370.1 hypothetical protein [Deltaproteobacteria bacterium]
MDMKSMALQMVDLQKAAFDNGYETLVTMQDQAEKVFNAFVDQTGWFPSESKGVLSEWVSMYKKGRDDFKKAVDDGFDHLGGYLTSSLGRVGR